MPHLSLSQRQTLELLNQQGFSQSAMAREIGVHRSTVKRELERNGAKENYQAERAHQLCLSRKAMAGMWSQMGKKIKEDQFVSHPTKNKTKKIKRRRTVRCRPFRTPDYRPYVYRKDFREYYAHGNKRRSQAYYFWKKAYEPIYRIRCYQQEEANRLPRDYYTFKSYYQSPKPDYIRRHKLQQQLENRFRREKYEEKWRSVQLRAIDRQVKLIGLLLEEAMKEEASEPQEEKAIPALRPVALIIPARRRINPSSHTFPLFFLLNEQAQYAHAPPDDTG